MTSPQDPAPPVWVVIELGENIKAGTNPAQVHSFGQRSNPVKIIHFYCTQSGVIGA